jgi:2'-5' RNA ligase
MSCTAALTCSLSRTKVAIRLRALHDELSAFVLRTDLREDIAFVPHITIAGHRDLRWCDACAERANFIFQPWSGLTP